VTLGPAATSNPPFFRFAGLRDSPTIRHGVFTRAGGVSGGAYAALNCSRAVGDDPAHVRTNLARIAATLGFATDRVFSVRQVHGAAHRVISADGAPDQFAREEADILVTGAAGVLLLLKFADCTPLVLWDAAHRWIALAHAGWRGTAERAAAAAVDALSAAAGVAPTTLRAAIGPAIGPCCYEVGPEVAAAVAATVRPAVGEAGLPPVVRTGPRGRPHVDLAEANRQQLLLAGLPSEHVEVARRCTACHAGLFFSHRALGSPAGRFAVAVGLT
jgi:YfiH family protein